MHIYKLILSGYLTFITGCSIRPNASPPLVDSKADKETVSLRQSLYQLLSKGVMFGHQDDLAYGVNWKYEAGRSDIHDITGDYPAVQGFDLGHLERGDAVNLDSVPFDRMKEYIRKTYAAGGIITISWHLRNPLTGKTSWDASPGTVASILKGGEKHELYLQWLNKVADFLQDLKGINGESIPVIFRPFHELNGSWFWWGKAHCSPDEFKSLWKLTVTHLRDTRGLSNILYAFNTDKFYSEEEYLERYPGDEWVDIIGFDIYQREPGEKGNREFSTLTKCMLSTLEKLSLARNKIPAITEFGFNTIPDSTWWTNTLLPVIKEHKLSYVLAWRNAGRKSDNSMEYFVPFRGQISEKNFMEFYNDKHTIFLKDITPLSVYSSKK